jgi:peptidoglycan/LPS O-acetylase OafA/YrhL
MTAKPTPAGILITVALLALYGAYAIWQAISNHSLLFALAGVVSIVACVAAARLLAWSRFLVWLLAAAFIGAWAYSVYAGVVAGYYSTSSGRQIAIALAPGILLVALSCFCAYAVFKQFRAPARQAP